MKLAQTQKPWLLLDFLWKMTKNGDFPLGSKVEHNLAGHVDTVDSEKIEKHK